MANMRKLRAQMVEKGISVEDLAKMISVDKATVYRWLSSDGTQITIKSADAICKSLMLSPELAHEIFFGSEVADVRF